MPRAQDFPRRNRIISGVALGVLIVEAARRSGTLITARMAGEQGREVFAVPGHPLDPRAEGTNGLLKTGATLVTEPDDILQRAGTPAARAAGTRHAGVPAGSMPRRRNGSRRAPDGATTCRRERCALLDALGPAPVDVDELGRATGLSPRAIQIGAAGAVAWPAASSATGTSWCRSRDRPRAGCSHLRIGAMLSSLSIVVQIRSKRFRFDTGSKVAEIAQ